MSVNIRAEELNSRTVETEKIYCPYGGVIMVMYDKRHKPKINVYNRGDEHEI